MSEYTYVSTNSKGDKVFRRDTDESLEFVVEYLEGKGLEYEVREGAKMLWIYASNNQTYSYYYTTGRWAPYCKRGYPKKHYMSKGINDFITRYVEKDVQNDKDSRAETH
jgi:hypoxanthine phosphoribosyltransferase